MKNLKEKVRPYFGQLVSLLEQIPNEDKNIQFDGIKSQLEDIILSLNQITGNNYSMFGNVQHYSSRGRMGSLYANSISIRSQLGGLIGLLGSTYFSDEQKVAAPGTQVVVSQQSSQSQNIQITIALEMQELLTRKEKDFSEGGVEREFIKKFKDMLPTIQTITQLLNSLITLAHSMGISSEILRKILS